MTAVTILLGILALLLIPVEVGFEFARTDVIRMKLLIRCLFGLIRARVNLPRPAGTKPDADKRAQQGKKGAPRQMLRLFRQTAFRRRLYRFARDLIRAIRVKRLDARVRLGLDDPAETGRLWALIGPLNTIVQRRDIDIRVEPDFVEPAFELEARGRIILIPLQFAMLAVIFALSPSALRAYRQLRSSGA